MLWRATNADSRLVACWGRQSSVRCLSLGCNLLSPAGQAQRTVGMHKHVTQGRAASTRLATLEDDAAWMRLALDQAWQASEKGEVPVGAVLVHEGQVIAAAHNRVEETSDPTAHAEMLCLQAAARHTGGWRLLQSSLYVTLEPCPMCAGALLLSRIGSVIYGAKSPLFGADGSWVSLLRTRPAESEWPAAHASRSGLQEIVNHAADPQRPFPLHPDVQVRMHVLGDECSHVMQQFFRRRRAEPPRWPAG